MKSGLKDANPDARKYSYSNFYTIKEMNFRITSRIWNECDEDVHRHLNKTSTSLISNNISDIDSSYRRNIKKNTDKKNIKNNLFEDDSKHTQSTLSK